MADLASLKIAVDSRDVKTATTDLGGMSSAAARSEGAIGKFGSTVRIATAQQRELNNAIKSTDQAYRSAATYVSQLVDQTKRLGMSSIELKKLEIATAAAAAPTAALKNEIRAAGAEYLRAMRSAQGFNAASGGVVASAGAQRAGMQQLSFQIGDVAQQFALGTSPMVIFAQQGGQVVQALSMMRGSAGGLLGFLAGPWGSVIMGAGMILAMMFNNTKKAEQGTLDLADALNIQAMSARDLIGAINQLNAAQNKANATSYQSEVQARANAVAILNQANANRDLAKSELQVAMARFQNQNITSKAGLELKSAYAAQVGAARALLGEVEKAAANAEALLKAVDVPLIRRQAAAATDAAAAATLRYDKAELALRNSFMAGKLTRDQYLQQLVNLNKTKETEIAIAQKLEREQRKKPQVSEYERQQKAVREMITDMERELALVKAGTAADEARLRVQLARQGANAAQIAQIVQLTKDLAAEELKREEIKKRETFGNQISDLQTELGLIREGLSLEQARLRVQLARQGATQSEIDNIIRLNSEIEGIKKAAEDTKKTLEDWDKLTLDINFDSLFGNFGKALGGIVAGLDDVLEGQKKYQAAIKAAGTDSNKLAAIESKNKRLMVNNYANLLGSAKGFFKEGSSGYKVLQAAETAYRAVSIALALKEMAIKVAGYGASAAAATAGAGVEVAAATSVGAANAAAAVANQGKGDPFTAWARIAAMAALMAGLGFAVMGGGKSKPPVTNTGVGTVFGDSEAQSKSISSSIERLVDINASTMRYSSQMLNSLKNIEAAMVGVTNLVLRTSGINNLTAGVNTGNSANIGQRAGGTAAMAGAGAGLGFAVAGPVGAIAGAVIGGAMSLIKGLVSSLFGTTTSIVGQGITATAQSVADILATGFDVLYYTDIQKKKKFFGITTSTSYQTQTAAADAEINRQFSLVIQNIYDTVLATAGPLKIATDQVAKNMEDFVLNIGKIDVKGLTGEQIQERLTAVFGAAADNIAKAAIPGLEAFQKVGEGYFETIIRVASNIEVLDRAFQMLGQTTQSLSLQSQMALIETFGDATTLMEQVNEYFKTFYSETEQVAAMSKQLNDAFGVMNLTMPDTLAGFRALVEAQDLNTEAGRRIYAQLIQLSPAFAELISRMQELGQTEEVVVDRTEVLKQAREMEITLMELQGNVAGALAARRKDELDAMDSSLRPLQQMIYAQQDLNAAREAEQAAIADLRSAVNTLNANVAAAETKLADAMRAQRQRQMDSYRGQMADLDVIIAKRDAAQQALRNSYEAEIANLDAVIAKQEDARQALRAAYDAEITNLDAVIAKREYAQQALRAAYDAEIADLDAIISKREYARQALRVSYDAEIANLDAVIGKREYARQALRAAYDAEIVDLDAIIAKRENARQILRAAYDAEITTLNTVIAKRENAQQAVRAAYNAEITNLDAIIAKRESAQQAVRAAYDAEIVSLDAVIAKREVAQQAVRAAYNAEIADLDAVIAKREIARQAMRAAYDAEITNLNAIIAKRESAQQAVQAAYNAEISTLDAIIAKRENAQQAVKAAYDAEIAELDAIISKREVAQQALQRSHDAEISRIDNEISKRKENISSLESAFKDQASIFEQTIDQFRTFANSIREFAATIIPMNGNGAASLAGLRARFAELAALAIGGDKAAMGQVTDIGGQLREAIIRNAPDRLTMLRQLYALQAQTNDVAAKAEMQATVAEQQLAQAALQNQTLVNIEQNAIDQLNAQKDATSALVGQFIQLNEQTLSIADAISQLQTAEEAAIKAESQKIELKAQVGQLIQLNQNTLSLSQAIEQLQTAEEAALNAEAQKTALQNQISQLIEIKQATLSLDDAIKQLETAEAAALTAEAQKTALETQISQLFDITQATLSVDEAIKQLQTAEQAALNAEAQKTALQAQVSQLIQMTDATLSMDEAIKQLQTADEAALNAEAQKTALQNQVGQLIELKQTALSLDDAINELQTAEQAALNAEAQKLALQNQVSQLIELNETTLSLNDAINQLETAEQAALSAEAQKAALQTQVGRLIELNQATLSVDEAIKQLETAEQASANAEAQKTVLQTQVNQLIELKQATLSVDEAIKQLETAEQAAANAEAQKTVLETQVGQLIELKQITLSLDEAIKQLQTAEEDALNAEAQKVALENQVGQLIELNETTLSVDEAIKQLQTAEQAAENAAAQKLALENQVGQLIELKQATLSVDEAIKQLQTAEQAAENAEAQKAVLQTQVSQLIELNETTLSLNDAIKQLETADAAATKAEAQKVYLQSQIDALAAVDASVISVEQAQRELDAARAERDAVLEDIQRRGFADLISVTQLTGAEMARAAMAAIDAARAARDVAQASLDEARRAKEAAEAASRPAAEAAATAEPDAAAKAAAEAAAKAAAEAAARAAAEAAAKAAAEAAALAAPQQAVNDNFDQSQITTTVRDSYGGRGRDADVINPNIRPFAIGGIHSGGLRIVGENGPELEATGPSRIYNSNQLGSMLNHGATADEVKALREELKAAMYQIAKNTGKSYDLMNRWDGDGLPPERIVA